MRSRDIRLDDDWQLPQSPLLWTYGDVGQYTYSVKMGPVKQGMAKGTERGPQVVTNVDTFNSSSALGEMLR